MALLRLIKSCMHIIEAGPGHVSILKEKSNITLEMRSHTVNSDPYFLRSKILVALKFLSSDTI
jgi:hypothetical protein